MCVSASQVTAQSGRYTERRERGAAPDQLILSSSLRARRGQEWPRYQSARGGPGVLDPLVSALSDLQVVLSHLIMVQAP